MYAQRDGRTRQECDMRGECLLPLGCAMPAVSTTHARIAGLADWLLDHPELGAVAAYLSQRALAIR